MRKSIEEYLAAGGWSSNLFFEHAKSIFSDRDILRRCTFEVGRNVIYVRSGGKMLKIYVHHGGRSKEFMTFVNEGGDEIRTFHYTVPTSVIKEFILGYFNGENE